ERRDGGSRENRPVEVETRAVTGAVPGAGDRDVADDAPQVRAHGGNRRGDPAVALHDGDLLGIVLDDAAGAVLDVRERARAAPEQPVAGEPRAGLQVLRDQLAAASDGTQPGRIEQRGILVLAAEDQVGDDLRRRGALRDAPRVEAD